MTVAIEPVLDKYNVEYNPDKMGNQQVRCPFHEDTHASASVNLDKGLFNCYGCSIAGDAIALLMEREGMDYVAAKSEAEAMAGGTSREVQRDTDTRGNVLPRRSGHRPNRRQWKSPWSRSGA